jgi:hypothetical protein
MTHDEQIRHLHDCVREFRDFFKRPIVEVFPTLRFRLSMINELIGTIDLNHLSHVPPIVLARLATAIEDATHAISDYMVNSYPPEAQTTTGVGRPQDHARSRENIKRWESRLDRIHVPIYETSASVVTHQQRRIVSITTTPRIRVDAARSDVGSRGPETVWRYMPLANLIRSEAASGIWFSSLEKLRAWSARGIVDTREGDVPPFLRDLKEEYDLAMMGSGGAVRKLKQRYGFDGEAIAKLGDILRFSFDPQSLFVSSWSRKKRESTNMWSHYGDGGRGVAIRTQLRKLMEFDWRMPAEKSGLFGPDRLQGLLLRSVKYLEFDENDRVESVDDLYLPFLKRVEFDDEHEVRLLGFTNVQSAVEGITLICNLADLIEEIVVGPHGDLEQTKTWIDLHAADLRRVPIRRSSLA